MLPREIRLLLIKEVRQLRANRLALGTSFIPPVLFLLIIPGVMIAAAAHPPPTVDHPPALAVGLVGDLVTDPRRIPIYMMPIFCGLSGALLPIMLAIHAVVSERETRTFELLVALPVRLAHVLAAKVLAVLAITSGMAGLALSVTAFRLWRADLATPLEIVALYVELFAAMAAGTMSALMVGFHARDFRTAQNVSTGYVIPVILVTMLVGFAVGGGVARPLVLSALYALWTAGLAAHAARQSSFEQLLR